jgi:type II secretory pathway component GspD/PulD (secretin)
VQVNYVTASSLIGSVGAILTKRGKVVADTTSNSLIVTDTRSRVAEVSDFVKNLDIRTPQVSIQSKLIFVDRTDVQSLGLALRPGEQRRILQQAGATDRPLDG